jgi:hypothetical protein
MFPDLFTQPIETASEPDQWVKFAFVPLSVYIDLILINMLQQDLSDEQIVVTDVMESHNSALQIYRTLGNDRWFNILRW